MSPQNNPSQIRKFNIGEVVETTQAYAESTAHYDEAEKRPNNGAYYSGVIRKIDIRPTVGSSLITFTDQQTRTKREMDERHLQYSQTEIRGTPSTLTSTTIEDILNRRVQN